MRRGGGAYELAEGDRGEVLEPGELVDEKLLGEIELRDVDGVAVLERDGELLAGSARVEDDFLRLLVHAPL